jgi:hypothetical protein
MTAVPCAADPELWFSPVAADRDLAKRLCGTCLQLLSCAELGRDETWGIWAGVDAEQREAERLTAEMVAGVLEAAAHVPSRAAYVSGCRCDGCRAENTAWMSEWRGRDRVVTAPRKLDHTPQLAIAWEAS